ncbi:MAG TPA: metalloregulator ArsR/SmtB family transcription factor [Patescibacteria group bacterium]|nr:metalloregulator ArsR/SmtB family transcription factor [Patescibacteria group bacterium]
MLTRARLREKVKPFARRIHGVAHTHRLAILYLLAHEPMEVNEITDHLGLAENLVSHHLKQLYLGGWVLKLQRGRLITYRLNEKAFFEFNRLFEDTPFEKEVLSKYFK